MFDDKHEFRSSDPGLDGVGCEQGDIFWQHKIRIQMGDDIHGSNKHGVERLQQPLVTAWYHSILVPTHEYPYHDIVLGLEVLDTAQLEISRYALIGISAGLL